MSTAQTALRDLMEGFERSQLTYLAAKLKIPDALAHQALDAEALSGVTGVAANRLYRVMRGLVWCGLCTHEPDDRFALTPMGQLLRQDTEGTLYERALCIGEIEYPAWGALLNGVRQGHVPFEQVFGNRFYDHLGQQPEMGAHFDHMMGRGAAPVARSVVEAYDFSAFATVCDIGGSNGTMISTILQAHPEVQGVIFDLPSVIERIRERMAGNPRVRCESGDFFHGLPSGCDAYTMKWILHNWDDEHCAILLRNCRRAMHDNARLLVLEQVMPERVDTSTEVVGWDLGMFVHLGASERTAAEFRQLFEQAGLGLVRILPTSCGMSILEALPS